MHLTDLLKNLDVKALSLGDKTVENVEVKGLALDSRKVKQGCLFAALPGVKTNGADFIPSAIQSGAQVILTDEYAQVPDGSNIIQLISSNVRHDLSRLCDRFYAHQPETTIAVTGTNGKSSVVTFVKQIWDMNGCVAASLGTIGLEIGDEMEPAALTTPDSISLHETLDFAASEKNVSHLALEASSHGLDQCRLHGVRLSAAGFTNLTHEHLAYHETIEAYRAAKGQLFDELLPSGKLAVLNADDENFDYYNDLCKSKAHQIVTFGQSSNGIKILKRDATSSGQNAHLSVFGKDMTISLPLVGEFQLMNALCSAALCAANADNVENSIRKNIGCLETLKSVPGRLQLVTGHPKGAAIYVDYAHTPDALETVLKALRPHTENRLVCVVGCGGDRDKTKRPLMGRIANDLADAPIITDDNPRTEDPAQIRSEMMAAAPNANEIFPRDAAIADAVSQLDAGDVLLIAGKGHEQGQIIGTKTIPFDDVSEAEKAISYLSS